MNKKRKYKQKYQNKCFVSVNIT